jgi:hypothetical protein
MDKKGTDNSISHSMPRALIVEGWLAKRVICPFFISAAGGAR